MVNREDFEASDELVEVGRRPRAGVVVSVRVTPEEADQLQRVAEARKTTVSRVARDAITAYLRGGAGGATLVTPVMGSMAGFSSSLQLISHNALGAIMQTYGSVRGRDPVSG